MMRGYFGQFILYVHGGLETQKIVIFVTNFEHL